MSENSEYKVAGQILLIPCNKIITDRIHPRKNIDGSELIKFSNNIKNNGIIIPITVRPIKYNRYEVINGVMRLRAAKLAGMSFIPSIIIKTDNKQKLLFSLYENHFRKNLDFFEEAEIISNLLKYENINIEYIAETLSLNINDIKNKLKLLYFPRETKIKIINYGITEKHCIELLKLDNNEDIDTVISEIIKNRFNVYQTSQFIKNYKNKQKQTILFKDLKVFTNTINHTITTMKKSGINVSSSIEEDDEFINYSISILKNNFFAIKSHNE